MKGDDNEIGSNNASPSDFGNVSNIGNLDLSGEANCNQDVDQV